ncbi:hypothetical protein Trydic_g2625 [Trypoxylus dichotomus]
MVPFIRRRICPTPIYIKSKVISFTDERKHLEGTLGKIVNVEPLHCSLAENDIITLQICYKPQMTFCSWSITTQTTAPTNSDLLVWWSITAQTTASTNPDPLVLWPLTAQTLASTNPSASQHRRCHVSSTPLHAYTEEDTITSAPESLITAI